EGSDLDFERWDETVHALGKREKTWLTQSAEKSRKHAFLHWDLDFPDVLFTARRTAEWRRFDALIGNPPWGADSDEIELAYFLRKFRWNPSQPDTYIEFT